MEIKRDDRGYIVVETVGSFLLFFFLVISILALVNVTTAQARIHYALTQTASELSVYCYVLEAAGIADAVMELDETAEDVAQDIKDLRESFTGLVEGLKKLSPDDVVSNASDLSGRLSELAEDPEETFVNTVRYLLSSGKDVLADRYVLRPLVAKYLRNGDMDADTYLKSINIEGGLEGLSFGDGILSGAGGSKFLDKDGNITIVVRYTVNYRFGSLPLPFPGLRVTQRVKTKAWLGGEGEGYQIAAE